MEGGRTATFGLQSLGRTGNFVWKRPGRTDIFRRIKSSLGCDIRLANYPQTNLAAIGTGAPFHSKMQQFQPHDTEWGKRRRGEKTKRNGQDDAQLAAVSKEEGDTLHTFSHFYCLFCLEEGGNETLAAVKRNQLIEFRVRESDYFACLRWRGSKITGNSHPHPVILFLMVLMEI